MSLVQLATAPDAKIWIGRPDAIVALDPPFAWSRTVQARVVHLLHGDSVIVLDTPANVAAVLAALDPSGSAVHAVTPAVTAVAPTGGV